MTSPFGPSTCSICQGASLRSRNPPGRRYLDGAHAGGLQSLGPLGDLELDPLALLEALVAVHIDLGEVDEDVVPVLTLDEALRKNGGSLAPAQVRPCPIKRRRVATVAAGGKANTLPPVTGRRAESIVVWVMRFLALSFAVVGICFIADPDGTIDNISDLGDHLGDFTRAPHTEVRFWLALAFAYMVVIAGIALVVSLDVRRYRPLLLVLAAGKAASSLAAGVFYLQDDVFIYLLNFLVDGSLVLTAMACWVLAGRVGPREATPP